jgi:putative SOS response-associated peptidase YedK
MCGRFSIIADVKTLEQRFNAIAQQSFWPHYNAAPSQPLPIITSNQPGVIKTGRWGLQPSWLKSKLGLINARVESVRERPAFRDALAQRRCLVLADGFFEWDYNRQPFYFTLPNKQPFAFAGIWEPTRDASGNTLRTFTIITTIANSIVTRAHNRMPVILEPNEESIWLDPNMLPEKELALLNPYTLPMKSYRVSNLVNSVKNDTPDVIKPI